MKNLETVTKYIPVIRKFNGLPISEIKKNIETGYAVSCNWNNDGDFIDEINDTNPRYEFRKLIDRLLELGATLELYEEYDGEVAPINLEYIDNNLKMISDIREEVERDVDRELSLGNW